MERVFTLKKRFLFPVLLFIFIAIIFTIGCTNHLLKPHQSDPSILVKLEKSSGRNVTTGDYQITTWIENRDGTESHHQNLNSASGEETSLIFDNLVIGSQINIHLELTKNDDSQTKLTGESGWITVKEGTNVVVIVLREDSDTGEIDDPVAGDDSEDEGDPVLSRIVAQYDSNQYQLVNTNIDPSKITITQYYDNEDTGTSVKASEVSDDYTIAFAANASINSSIGNVPATVTHVKTQITANFTIPVKYTLDASNLTINGSTSVEQNGTLELVANYPDTTYQIHGSDGSTTPYKVKDNLNISWQGATAQSDAWKATANTQTTGQNTATVKLTSTDTEWCVTTSEITASHTYTVTAVTASIGDIVYSDGTISTNLNSGKKPVGIVIKTTDNQPTLILALNDSDTNTATYVTYSKAETACASYGITCGDGKTWRIPTLDELKIVSNSLSTFQTALTKAGGTEMEKSAMYYWTTTKSGSNYQRILMNNGSTVAADANATHTRARFVRDWQ